MKNQGANVFEQARPLDDTPPTQEQYNRFYALAKHLFDLKPWEQLTENQLVAVDNGDGKPRFVSVMGALGSHFAVSVYSSLSCWRRFAILNHRPDYELTDTVSRADLSVIDTGNA